MSAKLISVATTATLLAAGTAHAWEVQSLGWTDLGGPRVENALIFDAPNGTAPESLCKEMTTGAEFRYACRTRDDDAAFCLAGISGAGASFLALRPLTTARESWQLRSLTLPHLAESRTSNRLFGSYSDASMVRFVAGGASEFWVILELVRVTNTGTAAGGKGFFMGGAIPLALTCTSLQ